MSAKFNNYILPDKTLKEALNSLRKSALKTLIVVNKKEQYLGTLTDGDIRRELLKKNSLNKKIKEIYNKNSTYFFQRDFSKQKLKQIFLKEQFMVIPIIDINRKVVNVVTWSELFSGQKPKSKIDKNVGLFVMAGGLGTRLQPFTNILPKPLIPLNGKPVIEQIIDFFKESGISEIYVSINYKAQIMKSFFRESKNKFKVKFIEEKNPLGTAGSLSLLKKKDGNIFVTNCDSIFNFDLYDFYDYHIKSKKLISIVVSQKHYVFPYGDCFIDKSGNLKNVKEKPEYNFLANAGLYIINTKIIKYIPKNKKFDFVDLLNKLIKNKIKIGVYPISELSWQDTGDWTSFNKLMK